MRALELHRVMGRTLAGIDLQCDPGILVVLGSTQDGVDELTRILAGLERPRRGVARVAGADPFRSPGVRRRIGSLLSTERLPDASSVRDSVSHALIARRDASHPNDVLGRFGLEAWANRPASALTDAEHRAVALALALSIPAPALLVLEEPFACAPAIDNEAVTDGMASAVASGAPVVCFTSSPRDAALLAAPARVLERGRWSPQALPVGGPGIRPSARAIVRTDHPRELAAALAHDADVLAVSFEASSPRGEVVVTGVDVEVVALAIARVARREALPVKSIDTSPAALHSPGSLP